MFAEAKTEGTMSKMSNPRQWVHDALQGEGSTFRHAVGVDPAKAMHRLKNAEVFSGSSNPVLAEEVAYELHRPLGKMEITRYADGEISVKVLDSVRGKDVFVVQSTSQPVNENLMELLLTVSTMRRASAKSITAVIPYMGYKRDTGSSASTTQQLLLDQMATAAETAPNVDISEMLSSVETGADAGNGGGSSFAGEPVPGTAEYLISQPKQNRSAFPVSAADVAAMLQVMGVDRIITVDLQLPGQGQSEVRPTERSPNHASFCGAVAGLVSCEANTVCNVLVVLRIVGNVVLACTTICIASCAARIAPLRDMLHTTAALTPLDPPLCRASSPSPWRTSAPPAWLCSTSQSSSPSSRSPWSWRPTRCASLSRRTSSAGSPSARALPWVWQPCWRQGPRAARTATCTSSRRGRTTKCRAWSWSATSQVRTELFDAPLERPFQLRGASLPPTSHQPCLPHPHPPRLRPCAGCDVILVDDMIDTGVTLMRRLDILKRLGARRIVSFATHGLFNGSALQRITRSPLSDVIVTNTVPLREDVDTRHTHKIAQLSVAPLIAEAILRVQTEQSLQDLRVFDRDGESARYKGQE